MAEEIKKLIDIAGLTKYHEKLTHVLETKANEAAADATSKANAAQAAAEATAAADATSKANAAEQNAKDYADGKFQVAGSYETAGAAAQALADAKADAAEKYQVKGDYETAGAAAAALDSAKSYVDGKVDGKFDAAGAAEQALEDAKDYADSLAGNYDAAGTAAGLNTAMDARVVKLEAIDHEKLASAASAAAVATVLDGAPEKFDTLKEVAQWIADSESAATAADLVTRVAALEGINHDAYVEADKTVLADAKTYADGLVMVDGVDKFDAAGTAASAAAQALADAKADAASLYQVKGDYATVGQVNAKQDTITDLETIRSGAAAGATALQSVPEEYVTETELTGKGYLTANDFGFATDADIDKLFGIQ